MADTASKTSSARFAYVGSRTTKERKARGKGIEVYKIGADERSWEHVQRVEDLTNPSFLITDRTSRFLYTVHGDESEVSSFSIDAETGKLTKLGTVSTKGKNPVHLVIDEKSNTMLIANYATGTIASLPILEDGKLGEAAEPLALPGEPGPHKIEQKASHPHQIVADPSKRFYLVPDKGLDRIFTLEVGDKGAVKIVSSVATRQGAGPRHAVFDESGKFVHVVNELDSTVTAYAFDTTSGALTPIEIVSTLPSDFTGDSRAAAVVSSADGSELFVTNRGHNSVAAFRIDQKTAKLSDPNWHETAGKGPRFAVVSPSGKTLFAANELTDSVVAFEIDDKDGLGKVANVVETGSPVSIVFI
ncbi:lactonase family protein [Agrobacterium larrymoorei]|uniref:Lactonase family protein n=1 Tax=Agrobacterium larrymoorei TaxID=160699 RepID=A0AAF0KGB4_9HYPH|nr:lactonase family protein [Agrobacterium larrymoorei]WHA44006.1 lactonase family protein [Agrobacterium larrymoorei]